MGGIEKTSQTNLASLLGIKASGSSLKAFSKQHLLKAGKLRHSDKNRQLNQK